MASPFGRTIYLDYNATTPLDPAVRAVVADALEHPWGNPSSVHQVGRLARALLDDARDRLAQVFRCRAGELVFTSGGTEANNLAIFGTARARASSSGARHLLCSAVEHPAVLQAFEVLARREGFVLESLPVDSSGRVSPASVASALRPDTALVSVMAANNEIGVLQPFEEIGRLCRSRGVPFHCDAVQWFGKLPLPGSVAGFEADLVTFCAHKVHGPKGAGALWLRSPLPIEPLLVGGGHELDRRAGTENLPGILGLVAAAERFLTPPVFDPSNLLPWTQRLASALASVPGITILGESVARLPNTLGFTVEGSDSLSLVANLDLAGVCASSGSACSSGSITPSHVLQAMGFPPEKSASLVRLSLGRHTTSAEIDYVVEGLPTWIARARTC